jgi:hypothetical protein
MEVEITLSITVSTDRPSWCSVRAYEGEDTTGTVHLSGPAVDVSQEAWVKANDLWVWYLAVTAGQPGYLQLGSDVVEISDGH